MELNSVSTKPECQGDRLTGEVKSASLGCTAARRTAARRRVLTIIFGGRQALATLAFGVALRQDGDKLRVAEAFSLGHYSLFLPPFILKLFSDVVSSSLRVLLRSDEVRDFFLDNNLLVRWECVLGHIPQQALSSRGELCRCHGGAKITTVKDQRTR